MSQDLTSGFSTEETLKSILAAVGRLEAAVADLNGRVAGLDGRVANLDERVANLNGRVERIEEVTAARSKETRPMSERIDQILSELVDFKAEACDAITDARNRSREDLAAESRMFKARFADLERRIKILEERAR